MTSSPGFLGQWLNNLQWAALLTSLIILTSKFGQQQLVMVNYAYGFNQSETGKYFELIFKNSLIIHEPIKTPIKRHVHELYLTNKEA